MIWRDKSGRICFKGTNLCRGLSESSIPLYSERWDQRSWLPALQGSLPAVIPAIVIPGLSQPHLAQRARGHVCLRSCLPCTRHLQARKNPTFPPPPRLWQLLPDSPGGIMEGGRKGEDSRANPGWMLPALPYSPLPVLSEEQRRSCLCPSSAFLLPMDSGAAPGAGCGWRSVGMHLGRPSPSSRCSAMRSGTGMD